MNNINFKGYTNILSVKNVKIGDLYTSYIGMKLDDNNGYKDLSELKKIHELQGYRERFNNDDILTITYAASERSEDIFFCEKAICWGEQLKIIKDEYIPKFITESKYKQMEDFHLKAYTLLASLTKRMSCDKFEHEDQNITRVIDTLNKNLRFLRKGEFILFDQHETFELLSAGCLKHFKFQSVAKGFNKIISRSMSNFFV
jgi:hypothetical protein